MKLGKKESLLLISLILPSGCSYLRPGLTSTHDDPFFIKQLQNNLNRLCFNSEGKGRVQMMDQKYLFAFESLHVGADGLWKLAIDLPMAGQELLSFGYSDIESGKLRLGGSFYRRIKSNPQKEWTTVLTLLGRFFKWMDQNRAGDMSEVCERKNKTTAGECKFAGGSKIYFEMEKDLTLIVNKKDKIFTLKAMDQTSDGYYKKLFFSLRREKDFGPRNTQFKLDLFLDSCSEPVKFL